MQFKRSAIDAWGVFADVDIAADEFVVEYIGEVITSEVADLREKEYQSEGIPDYLFRVDDDTIIDATKMGSIARFLNHSCDPNCFTQIINVGNSKKIGIYAKRDISKGEELCYDYKFPLEDEKIPCRCGASNCRKYMN